MFIVGVLIISAIICIPLFSAFSAINKKIKSKILRNILNLGLLILVSSGVIFLTGGGLHSGSIGLVILFVGVFYLILTNK